MQLRQNLAGHTAIDTSSGMQSDGVHDKLLMAWWHLLQNGKDVLGLDLVECLERGRVDLEHLRDPFACRPLWRGFGFRNDVRSG